MPFFNELKESNQSTSSKAPCTPITNRSPPHRLTLSRNTTLKGRPLENTTNTPLSTREDENLISTSRPFIRLATEVFLKTFIN